MNPENTYKTEIFSDPDKFTHTHLHENEPDSTYFQSFNKVKKIPKVTSNNSNFKKQTKRSNSQFSNRTVESTLTIMSKLSVPKVVHPFKEIDFIKQKSDTKGPVRSHINFRTTDFDTKANRPKVKNQKHQLESVLEVS